jgi:hypothetical protein
MANERKATEKRSISTVSFTVTFTANKVNENGTLSGITAEVVKQSLPKDNPLHISIPPMLGGGMFAKVTNANGLSYLTTAEAGKAKAEKVKLF